MAWHFLRKKNDEAITQIKLSIDSESKDALPFLSLAEIELFQNRLSEAESYADSAKKLNSENYLVYYTRPETQTTRGDST